MIDMKRVFIEMFLLTPEENIELAKKLNVGVELFLKTNILIKLTTRRIKEWKGAVKGIQGLSTHGPYRDLVLGSFDPLIREVALKRYMQAIEVTTMLNAEWMVIHLNFDEHTYGYPKAMKEWIRNAMKSINKLLERKKLILLENTTESDPDIFLNILRGINSDFLGLCFDVGHAYAFSNKDLSEWTSKLSPFIKEVHLHESTKGVDAHLPLGSGHIDINKVLSEIEKESSDFVITLEPRSEEDLYRNIEWLRSNGWIE